MPPLVVLRLQKPWTQRELAEAAGVHENTILAIERGSHGRLRPRTMRAIARALRVAVQDIDEFRESLQPPPH